MVISEQKRTQSDLTEQIGRLEREAGELSGERDRLNWTMGVILEHQNFPVAFRCPNRGEPDRQTDKGGGVSRVSVSVELGVIAYIL